MAGDGRWTLAKAIAITVALIAAKNIVFDRVFDKPAREMHRIRFVVHCMERGHAESVCADLWEGARDGR